MGRWCGGGGRVEEEEVDLATTRHGECEEVSVEGVGTGGEVLGGWVLDC